MLTVVLGGGVTPDGNLPRNIIKRLEKALEVYSASHSDAIVCSGKYSSLYGLVKPKKTEAKAMSEYLQKRGVAKDRIILEQKSRNTLANAYYLKKDIFMKQGERRGIIITSNYHVDRVKFVFEKTFGSEYELEFQAAPHEFDPATQQKVEERQAYLLEQTKEFLKDMKDGDHEYLKHRMYRFLSGVTVPAWVASFVSHG